MLRFDDPPCMPGTGESPAERPARTVTVAGTSGDCFSGGEPEP